MQDPSGQTSYSYDRRGLLTTQLHDDLGLTFGYDADGNRSRVGYPSGSVAQYTFDFAGRPLSVTAGGTPFVTSATYLPFGPMTSIGFGNGILKTMAYDARYRLSRNTLNTTSSVVADYAYQYDLAGNITQLHDAVTPGYNRDFAYDDLNRLTTANSGAALWGAASYQYDRMGNMLSSQLGSRTQTFVYSGTTPRIQSLSGTISESVNYDDAGNETNLGLYSPRNQLKQRGQISNWVNAVVYDYDGRGVRVSATIRRPQLPPQWGGGTTTRRSLYSPELNLLAQTGWSALTLEGSFEGTEYLWFAGMPVGQTFTDPETSPRYTFTDHLGTPILETDAGGAVVWRVEYEPYGSVYAYRAGDDSDPQALRFPGQEARDDAGLFGEELSYNIFRWYRAGWGRYTQGDPIGLQGGLNLYRYAGANPLSNIDRLGLVKWNCSIGYVSYETPGAGAGAATMAAKCQSECVNRKRVNASVMGNLGGASAASPLPAGVSYSTNVTLEDDFAEPREDARGGLFVIGSIGGGAGFGPLNGSFTYYRLGAANGYSIGVSPFMVSLGIDAYMGAGSVIESNMECCE